MLVTQNRTITIRDRVCISLEKIASCIQNQPCNENDNLSFKSIIIQLIIGLIVFKIYNSTRGFSKMLYLDHPSTGELHAEWLFLFEKLLKIDFEKSIQLMVIDNTLLLNFCFIYYAFGHIFISYISYMLMLIFSDRKIWNIFMKTVWFTNFLALIIYSLIPMAPPRLLNSSNIVDTFQIITKINRSCDKINNDISYFNCYAAMPSIHTAWAFLSSIGIIYILKSTYKNIIIINNIKKIIYYFFYVIFIIHPFFMIFVIIITGNHWILDIVAGLFTLFIAYKIAKFTEPN